MSSGEYAARLWRRAVGMLEGARWRVERGEYDLACFEAEQAAQLALKSLTYELLGGAPRIHDLGELLGLLHRALEEGGPRGPRWPRGRVRPGAPQGRVAPQRRIL